MDKYNPDTFRIDDYIDFFENKCKILDIDNSDLQKDLLLNLLTPEIFHELKVALTPDFDIATYSEICNKLLDLYRIKTTRYRALTEFWNCTREQNETMEHYANRLKGLSRDCGYTNDFLERQLRDRFATGLNHPDLETDLKQKWPDLVQTVDGIPREVTFQQIFTISQSREQAEQDTPRTSIKKINRSKTKTVPLHQNTTRKLNPMHCLRCGKKERHSLTQCSAKDHICKECNTKAHFESCCIKSGRAYISYSEGSRKSIKKITRPHKSSTSSSSSISNNKEESDDEVICSVLGTRKRECKQIDVRINDIPCTMDWDPGSAYSIINTTLWKKLGSPSLQPAPKLKAYGNTNLKTKGITKVTVEVDGLQKLLPVVVMKNAKPMLFGLHWSEVFEMEFPKPVYSIKTSTPMTLKQILDKHVQLFDGKLGKVNNYYVNIHVKPEAEPIHLPARPIKFSMKKNIERELDRLISEGIVEKVDPNVTPIEWATPTVNILKSTGEVRICGDYRTTLNPVLIKHLHPVPIFDQLRQNLANGKLFSKIDLKDAYLQFEIAPDSKKYLTLSTHKGYFQYNRMPFGISTAPSIFQHFLDQLLGDITNVAVYFDDIAIAGKDLSEHLQTLSIVFDRLQNAGLKVNLKKCNFLQNQIEYLGHIIDKHGIHPTKSKIDAITKAPAPCNAKELRSFLGLVNFYERFVPHLHGICSDLHDLTSEKNRWRWTDHENRIFEDTKKCIASSQPLIAFDEKRPLYLACDASEKGLGAVLFHKDSNIEQPIAFASRKLRPAEMKYSVIDREALAIVFGIKKFDQYLRGTKFNLVTDHKPLIHIMGAHRNLPKLANNRLVRWALVVGSYQYDIYYRKGENNTLADCLSRLPNPETEPSETEGLVHKIDLRLLSTRMTDLNLSEQLLMKTTSKDHILTKVCQNLKTGWRESEYNPEMKPFYRNRTELSVENKILMRQGRIVIPTALRKAILTYLHRGHPGISAMKALSRYYVWWPNLDEDIELFVKKCTRCQQNRPCNPELPVFSWSIPEEVWERIHIDFAGPFEGSYWLVLCDALSKWVEIRPMKHINTRSLCLTLDNIFCTFGLPKMIISDNGPQFTSYEFKEYCTKQSILHVTSSPYHPRTNGLAERLVRTFKNRMASVDNTNLERRLLEFLFTYRNTPHSSTGKSPAEMMFGRQLNCILSNIRPDKRRLMQYLQVKENIRTTSPSYRPSDQVYIKTRNDKIWEPAVITSRKHKYSYIVSTPGGLEKRRHADHIRPRESSTSETPRNERAHSSMLPATASPDIGMETTINERLTKNKNSAAVPLPTPQSPTNVQISPNSPSQHSKLYSSPAPVSTPVPFAPRRSNRRIQ
ncbi:uncharacterized protein K02A2.6-like [Bombyx mori]|uniref:RNA-directed DNA polymerase n=1 Tax=Bombyx mori TaxID=7091 RepID=A0A8R2M0U7_BOMMO|nr:uncharacterized protein K02A2.6-like [Bombyx mori]